VYIEDQLVVDNLDVVAATGGALRALVITTLPVYVSDGTLTITMNATVGQVMISGIEVIASANTVTHRINCGSTSNTLIRMNDITWSKDMFALSGATSNRCTKSNITDSIYCSSRYFRTSLGTPLRYNIPVPYNNAWYALKLYFNEHVRGLIDSCPVFPMPKNHSD
jgi:Malectin domain